MYTLAWLHRPACSLPVKQTYLILMPLGARLLTSPLVTMTSLNVALGLNIHRLAPLPILAVSEGRGTVRTGSAHGCPRTSDSEPTGNVILIKRNGREQSVGLCLFLTGTSLGQMRGLPWPLWRDAFSTLTVRFCTDGKRRAIRNMVARGPRLLPPSRSCQGMPSVKGGTQGNGRELGRGESYPPR